ncbi:MAG: heparinase [Firmicutes bacterium]|nr:heparinase [Bacillota bacterium]
MLKEKVKLVQDSLIDFRIHNPFPKYQDREKWGSIPQEVSKPILEAANMYLNYSWGTLPPTRYMDFFRDGNRTRFEAIYFLRRTVLGSLVLAECIEGKGRFLDDIINGVWLVCEESSWVLPAHNYGLILPDINRKIIDLFAAETGSLLSWIHFLLGSEFDKITPIITARIQHEIKQRLINPYLTENYFWMGFNIQPGSSVGNWNPWINSNCLTAFLLIEESKEKKLAGIEKIMNSLDIFLDGYFADGGCDEGPSYWNRAAGSLFDCLELLILSTDGAVDIYNEELIKNIGRYIYRVNIFENYFVNFADGDAKGWPDPAVTYSYGRRISDPKLMNLGKRAFRGLLKERRLADQHFSLFRILSALFCAPDLLSPNPEGEAVYERDSWLDGIQVMVARQHENGSGLTLAAKGGHNAEQHNHNDVGNFVIFSNGLPAIIDVGVESYTAKTFSSRRYEIWTMQSSYHNLPTINTYQQCAGRTFCANDVIYQVNPDIVDFSLDISKAYPAEAQIVYWHRRFFFERSKEPYIKILDSFQLTGEPVEICLSLMTPCSVELSLPGKMLFKTSDQVVLSMEYQEEILSPRIETLLISDERLTPIWGNKLYRILLTTSSKINSGTWELIFSEKG